MLVALEPVALKGADDVQALRAGWRTLSGDAQAALRKSVAKTWQDRIVVALENLVSVRSLAGKQGQTLSFAAVDAELERGHLAAALEKVSAFPPEAQAVVKDWRARAQERLDLEKAFKDMAAHLIASGETQTEAKAAPQAGSAP